MSIEMEEADKVVRKPVLDNMVSVHMENENHLRENRHGRLYLFSASYPTVVRSSS